MPRIGSERLVKRIVDGLKVPAGKSELVVTDSALRGFGVRALPSGAKQFFVRYKAGGRWRRFTFASFPSTTVEQARIRAQEILADVESGADPSAERAAERKAETFAELAERYLEQHAVKKKKQRSVVNDQCLLRNHLLSRFGRLKVADVTRADVSKLHHEMSGTPFQANRAVALLSKMFNLAEKWGLRPDGSNPCRHVERYREHKRERFLTGEELARLSEVLAEVEAERVQWPTVVPLVRLLILTGARFNEIRTLQWEHVYLSAGLLRLPDSKTGAKVIHLNTAAREVLATMPRADGNPYVIFGAVEGRPLADAKHGWHHIRERAGLAGVRLHDLRHTFASYAVSGGFSLPLTGALLGHTQPQTTQRYAHLHRDPLAEANERIGATIAAAMNPQRPAPDNVVDLDAARRKG